MKKKKPWLSALLNFIFPGVGYIYLGKRRFLGYFLVLGTFVILIGDLYYQPDLPFIWYELFASFFLRIAFTYDVYTEAKNIKYKK